MKHTIYLYKIYWNGSRLCWRATCQGYNRCSTKMSIQWVISEI